ncbi:uncharacterized protein ACO6RY_14897 [Pungitius sinensis]
MVDHAAKMIKRFTSKMNRKFTIRERRERTVLKQVFHDLIGTDDESSKTSDAVEDHGNVPSGGQTDMEIIQSPEAVIVRQVNETMHPFLDDMSDSDFQNLQVDSSLEKTVPRGVLEELQESEGTDKKAHGSNVKGFFTQHFSKTWLNRILDQIKRKFRKDSDIECSPILMKHIDDILPALLTLDVDEAQSGKQKCMPPMLKGIPKSKSLIITQALTNILFQRMTGSLPPKDVSGPGRKEGSGGTMSPSWSNAHMYNEIWHSVWNFTGLLQWWQKTQVDPLAQRTKSALENCLTLPPVVDHQSNIPAETPAGPAEDNAALERVQAEIIIQKLVTEILKNCSGCISTSEILVILQGLVEKTLGRVDLDVDLTENNVKDLNNAIINKLSETIGLEEMVLLSLKLGDVAVENCIISVIKDYMTPATERRTCIHRLACCVFPAMNIDRKGHKSSPE